MSSIYVTGHRDIQHRKFRQNTKQLPKKVLEKLSMPDWILAKWFISKEKESSRS